MVFNWPILKSKCFWNYCVWNHCFHKATEKAIGIHSVAVGNHSKRCLRMLLLGSVLLLPRISVVTWSNQHFFDYIFVSWVDCTIYSIAVLAHLDSINFSRLFRMNELFVQAKVRSRSKSRAKPGNENYDWEWRTSPSITYKGHQ